jgi:hypothetical protein
MLDRAIPRRTRDLVIRESIGAIQKRLRPASGPLWSRSLRLKLYNSARRFW